MTKAVTRREKTLAAATLVVIVGTVILVFVVEPQLKVHRARIAEVRQAQLQLMKMRTDLLLKNRIDEAYRHVEHLIGGHGTDQQEISVFTREVSDLYAKLNLKTNSVKIFPVQNEQSYRLLSIRIELEGPVQEVLRFILAVEGHPQPLRIEQFALRAQDVIDRVQGSFLVTKVAAGLRV
jgi:hypothetical protein